MNAMQMQMDLGELAKGRLDPSPAEFIAARLSKAPTGEDRLMEMICERENMLKALKRVESNKGKPGCGRHEDHATARLCAPTLGQG